MPDQLDCTELVEKLLRNGISPRRVRRLIEELQDHFAELKSASLASGEQPAQAAAQARAELGSDAVIAEQILSKPELRSWSARWPWAFYGLIPIVAMLGVIVLATLTVVVTVKLIEMATTTPPAWLATSASSAATIISFIAPVALTAAICRAAIVRRSRWLWPVAGITATALFGGSFDIFLGWAEAPETLNSVTVNSTFIFPFPDTLGMTALRASVNMLLVLAPYLYWARRRGLGSLSNAPDREESAVS